MSKYPRKNNVRLFRDFEKKHGHRFQTNWELMQELHPDKFNT